MNCPKCQGTLRPHTFGQVEVDQCQSCQGVWLDLGELPQLIAAQKTSFSEATSETHLHDIITAPCPRCGGRGHMTRLASLDYDGLMMDSCPVCYGIWLDGGELAKLGKSEEKESWLDTVRRLFE